MKKKKNNIFIKILSLLFLVYIALLIAFESGYYDTKIRNKSILTKEAMAKFEEDIKNGEVVDVKDYLKEERVDYSTTVTKVGNKITNNLSKFMTKGLSGLFKSLKGLFW